jgi:phosphatidylserine/phosphatidylglycerophosphate/cardiolipin synthase-like enzyme
MQQKVSLIVQPGDSFFPIVRAIDKAELDINLTVFRMDDPIIQNALVEAQTRGVRVRLLISSSARGWEAKNRNLLKHSKKAGIATKEPSGDSKRARYHYKVMTVDQSVAFVFTFNPTRENLHYTRDFGVQLYDPSVASEINRLFNADWNDTSFTPDVESPLLISPFNSRKKISLLLASAEKSIHITDAKLKDPEIVRMLVDKARRGVEVQVLGDGRHGSELPSAIQSRATPRFKLHAKCTIIDGTRAVLGSMNLRSESLDRRREVCIVVDDKDVIKRLNAVFTNDWENRVPPSASAATIIDGQIPTQLMQQEKRVETGIVLISRTNALVRYPLRLGDMTIGRSEENVIVVADPLVSRHHAKITLDGAGCTLTDLGSGNGTFLNSERIEGTATLHPGDVLDIGGAEEFRLIEL